MRRLLIGLALVRPAELLAQRRRIAHHIAYAFERLLWRRFWEGATTTYYLRGHGYGVADVLAALEDVTGTEFADFFRRYVAGVEELPYVSTLDKVALRLVHEAGSEGYRLGSDPDAPEAARRIGGAWLAGR